MRQMLVRDSLLYIVAKVLPGAVGVATTALLTHLLEPQQYGIYGLALIIMTFGSTMAFDWIGLAFMRLYEARRDDARTIPTFITMFIVMLLVTLVVATIATVAVPAADRAIGLVGVAMSWAFAFFELISRFEIANFRPYRYLAMNLVRAALMLSCTVGAALLTRNPLDTAIGTGVGLALSALVFGHRWLRLTPSMVDRVLVGEMMSFGLPYAASMTMSGLLTSGVRSLVGLMGGASNLGFYTAALSLSQNTLVLIAAGIGSATYPLAVRAVEGGDTAGVHRQLVANGTLVMAIIAPASLGLALVSPELSRVLVGARFRLPLEQLIPWMAAGAFFMSIRAVYLDHAFQLGKQPMLQIWVTGITAVIALGGTALLIPRYGPVGAAIATLVAMVVSCLLAWIAGRSAHRMPVPLAPWLRIGVCCAVMGAAVLPIPRGGIIALLLKVLVGGAAYGACALALDVMQARAAVLHTMRGMRRRVVLAHGD